MVKEVWYLALALAFMLGYYALAYANGVDPTKDGGALLFQLLGLLGYRAVIKNSE